MKEKITLRFVVTICIALAITSMSVACSPQASGGTSIKAEEETAREFSWSPAADCQMCHATEAASMHDSSYQIALNHSDDQCSGCHTDEVSLLEVHDDVTLEDTQGTKRLKSTEVPKEACLFCHIDFDQVKQQTATSTALIDSNGLQINPHDVPATESHEELVCGDCHTMHSKESIEETAMEACIDCHHSEVFECNTCH